MSWFTANNPEPGSEQAAPGLNWILYDVTDSLVAARQTSQLQILGPKLGL